MQRGIRITQETINQILDDYKAGKKTIDIASKFGIHFATVNRIVRKNKNNLHSYIAVGDEVIITDALDRNNIGKGGILVKAHPIEVSNAKGELFSATRVEKYQQPVVRRHKAVIPSTLKRFIADFCLENDHLKSRDVAALFSLSQPTISRIVRDHGKNPHIYRQYSPRQYEAFKQQYLSSYYPDEALKTEKSDKDPILDQLAVEEISRKMVITDGNTVFEATLLLVDDTIHLKQSTANINLNITLDTAQSLSRVLEGLVLSHGKLARKEAIGDNP